MLNLSGFAEYAMEGDEARKNWVDQGVEVRLCDMRRDVDQWIVNATFIQLQQKHSCCNQMHNLVFHLAWQISPWLPLISSNHSPDTDGEITAILGHSRCCPLTPLYIKGKVQHTPLERIGGCSSPSPRPWAHRWRTINVSDTWPVRCQTYSYLPSCKASPSIGWWQRHMYVNDLARVHSTVRRPGFEPMTSWLKVQHLNHSATEPQITMHSEKCFTENRVYGFK